MSMVNASFIVVKFRLLLTNSDLFSISKPSICVNAVFISCVSDDEVGLSV